MLFVGIAFSTALSEPTQSKSVITPSSFEGFRMEDAIINVANTTGKAVVSISTERVTKIRGGRGFYFGGSPFGEDEFFRRFFEDFGNMPDRSFKQMGLGSGVIIDAEGYILTNEHVISDSDKITVKLPDGREFKGEVKGKDARSDLAIIKINANNLPVASLGESDDLKIGQWVVAIGNPFGISLQNPEPTVTVGVISALHRTLGRSLAQDRDYNDLIQTDAAINPGNSGGPLVNLKGEVVGINVAILSASGGYEGVGFAIPVNSAKRITSLLREGKKILYAWLGVTVQDLNEDMAKYFGLSDKNGVLVAKVMENSPAQKAGMKESDIIKQFDNKTVNNVKDLLRVVAQAEVGKKVKVALIRDKKELTLEVQTGERPQDLEEEAASMQISGWRGLQVDDLTPENARRYRLEEKQGVVVIYVEPDSPADEAGIITGDVILQLNKQPVRNMSDYQKAIQGLKGDCMVKTSRGFFLIKGE
jgi:serine protease Do